MNFEFVQNIQDMYRPSMPSRNEQIWSEQKRKLLIQFTNLTDADLHFETGRKQEMLERICVKLEKSEEEMDQIIQSYNHFTNF